MTWTKKERVFERNDGVCLKAIFAIVVFLHHFFIAMAWQDPFGIACVKLGGIGVGAFYLQSIYGLWKAYQKNGTSYAKRIFLQKIPALYAVQISINLAYYFLLEFGNLPFDVYTVPRILGLDIFLFQGESLINVSSWYMTTIILVYFFFGVSILIAGLVKEKRRVFVFIPVFALLILVYCSYILFFLTNKIFGRSLETLMVGLLLVVFEKKLLRWIVGWKYWLTFALITIFALFFFFFPQGTLFDVALETMTTLFVNLFVFVLMMRYTFGKAPLLAFMGKISFDFYLIHWLFFTLVQRCAPSLSPILVFLGVAGATAIVSYLYCTARAHTKKLVNTLWDKIRKKA